MSVLCTDEFMTAIKMNMPWKLVFPNYEKYPTEYKMNWNGDLKAWTSLIDNDESMVI